MGNIGHNYLTNCCGVRSQLLISGKFMFSCLGVTKVIYCSIPPPLLSFVLIRSMNSQHRPANVFQLFLATAHCNLHLFFVDSQREVKIIVSGRFTIFPERCLPFFNLSRANNSKGLFFKKKSFLNSIATF